MLFLSLNRAHGFVSKVKEKIKSYKDNEVYNTDQMRVELEMHSSHTLSFQGEVHLVALNRIMPRPTHVQYNQ